jgi:hypothetical protein
MIEAARDEGIAVLRVKENQFVVSVKLYNMIESHIGIGSCT